MGKVKRKPLRSGARLRPTGLPSVRETEQQLALEPSPAEESSTLPLLEKLRSPSTGDREWACRSLCHILEAESIQQLLSNRMVRQLAPLLVDSELGVREAAAGALRNLSVYGGGELCDHLVKEDAMTPLSLMLRECVSDLKKPSLCASTASMEADTPDPPTSSDTPDPPTSSDTPDPPTSSDTPSKGKRKAPHQTSPSAPRGATSERLAREQLVAVAEQGLYLLWNLGEASPVAVTVFNRAGLLPVVLHFLATDQCHRPAMMVLAAQCLHTLTEDNSTALRSLSSSPSSLVNLERLLLMQSLDPASSLLVVKASIAGVFQNLLPFLPDSSSAQTLRAVLSLVSSLLDLSVPPLLHTLASTPPPTPPQSEQQTADVAMETRTGDRAERDALFAHIENTLKAQQIALELLANMCYTEEEGEEEEEEWEEVEGGEVEREEGDDSEVETLMEAEDMSLQSSGADKLTPALSAVLEIGLHEKVWRMCTTLNASSYHLCSTIDGGEALASGLTTVHARSLHALQNLLSSVLVEGWGGAVQLTALWASLFTLLHEGGRVVSECPDAVTGVLLALMVKLDGLGADCVTASQLTLVAQLGRTADSTELRADIAQMLGTAGKMTLHKTPPNSEILSVVGVFLRDTVSSDGSLWVVATAMDALFDVFGSDSCPPTMFADLGILPVLQEAASTFRARMRVERRSLPHRALVESCRLNLPRFIAYMAERTPSGAC